MPRQEDTPMQDGTPMGPATNPDQPRVDGEGSSQPVRDTEQSTAGTVRDSAGQVAEQGRERITSQLGEQKMRISQGLGSASEAIRTASQQLYEQDQSSIARYVDQGAEQLDQMARYLQDRDVNDLIGDAESFARERPAIFLGGAFGLGLLAARFVKSSGQQARTPDY